MRLSLYRFITLLALPLVAFATWKRCKKYHNAQQQNPDTPILKYCIKSRFGLNPTPFKKHGIWIHAVSVGETRSIFPLLTELHKRYPDLPITLTNGSTQGAIQSLNFAPIKVQHQMVPFDYPFAVNRFLEQIQPKLVLMVETEIWPNLYQACSNRNIPIALINARLKQQSFETYRKWGGKMIANTLNQTEFIAAQSATDAEHFSQLGATQERVKILGNLKFDMQISPELLPKSNAWTTANHLTNRFIWVAASTHADPNDKECEELRVLKAHQKLLTKVPNALLILIPRHASRFEEVAGLLKHSELDWAQHSKNQPITQSTQVYFADSVGELMMWFASCDVAFIGGSLVEFGGHNILEPAALNKPVLSGPHFKNLQALYQTFIDEQAIEIVDNSSQLGQTLIELSQDTHKRTTLQNRAHACYQQNSGALNRLLTELKLYIV
ncbi:MAG: 3-deoxy-D-manno-octulosonic acid transferase [Thiotrichales bacterium]|nr:3-deoxy-D-manno-octulosonic acid transferase [Thiotrichales bacterium]